MGLVEHMRRVIAFSRATFEPGERTHGVADHVRSELREIVTADNPADRAEEWVDVVKLGLDGLWRAMGANGTPPDRIADELCWMLAEKQMVNELREWPDWRAAPSDKAIEHTR